MGRSSQGRRAASSLQMQPDGPVVASYGPAKTATLNIPAHSSASSPSTWMVKRSETDGCVTPGSEVTASRWDLRR